MTGASTRNKVDREQPGHTSLSIIVPILNEIDQLPELLAHLQQWQRKDCEVLIVVAATAPTKLPKPLASLCCAHLAVVPGR